MVIRSFPPLDSANEIGLLAAGGDLDVESLILAYRSGVFPWPHDGYPLLWFSPPSRAVLYLSELHIPKSLKKLFKHTPLEFEINNNFEKVIRNCANSATRGEKGTWITEEMIEAYIKLHKAGYAYSVEAYREENLVGGLYGVQIDNIYSGESMFYIESDASKLAFYFWTEELKRRGVTWIDCQMLTPLFERFGAREIPREEFMTLVRPR